MSNLSFMERIAQQQIKDTEDLTQQNLKAAICKLPEGSLLALMLADCHGDMGVVIHNDNRGRYND